MPMASTFEKKCFLCNVTEIDGNCLVDSQESSLVLCKFLNVPHLMNGLKKLENINYCHPCKKRIRKIDESLDMIKKLEKEVLEEKYLIELQLETYYGIFRNEFYYSPSDFGVQLVNEMKFKSINSKLKKVFTNQIDRKFCSKAINYRIMKNITITEKLKYGTFEEHISEESTPLISNVNSTEKLAFINDNFCFPSNSHFVDFPTNSPFNLTELPLISNIYNFDDIKLESLRGVTNDTTDVKDPFEGIVPEPDFVTGNSTTQKSFICGTCETDFDDYNQLDEHCRTHTGSKSIRFCPNELISKVSLNTNSYIPVKNLLKCKYCVKIFPNRFRLILHERIHINEKPFMCGYCEKTFRDRGNMKSHERFHINEKLSIEVHERIRTGEKLFKCRYCDKTFRYISTMKRHEYIHKKEKPFKCIFSEKGFSHKFSMKTHECIHTGEKPFKCRYCVKTFQDRSSLKSHECTHTEEKPFKCRYCDKTFRNSKYMKSHEHIHDGATCFKCTFCEKSFFQKPSMERHERFHTNEKRFKCGYCDKTFRDLSDLKRHERIHKAEKPFRCKLCEKSFSDKSNMERHKRIHTNAEKRYKCAYCDKPFRDICDLKRHENIHKEEKHFKCKFCEKGFSQKSGMKTHERIHTGEKPFKCGYCVKTFRDRGSSKKHERVHTKTKP